MAEPMEATMAKGQPALQKHSGKPKRGKAKVKGKTFNPASVLPTAPTRDDVEYLSRPRPALTRYPIDRESFQALQASAVDRHLPVAKTATRIKDKGKATELALHPGVMFPTGAALLEAPSAAPTSLGNFEGIDDTGWFPPDCTLAAGPEHVLLAVNSSVAIYTKTGAEAQAARPLSVWFSNVITDAKIFDPKALYDQHSNRWVLLAVAVPSDQTVDESYFLLSISQTADPLGSWWNYKIDATKDGATPTNNWADYPGLGVDSQAYYLTANMFQFGGNFAYVKLRILDKTPLLSGGAPTWTDFVKLKNPDGTNAFTVLPCHTFGAPQTLYLVNSLFTTAVNQNRLTLWSLTDPLGTPVLTRQAVATDPYSQPPAADQKGSSDPLNSGDVRVQNAVFRGGSVWTCLTTAHNWEESVNRASVHWFQINATSGALIQQGIYGAKKLHYYYPAVQPDANGNMTLVFSRSSSTEFASIRVTGRLASDPLGQLQPSDLLKAGLGSSVHLDTFGRNRWGDYAGIGSDPVDARQVWFHSMFPDLSNKWSTWVGVARF